MTHKVPRKIGEIGSVLRARAHVINDSVVELRAKVMSKRRPSKDQMLELITYVEELTETLDLVGEQIHELDLELKNRARENDPWFN